MEERDQQDQELTAKKIQPENHPLEDAPAPLPEHEDLERREPQPQYDSFMRVIRR